MTDRMGTRRRLLGTLGAGMAVLAGCSGFQDGGTASTGHGTVTGSSDDSAGSGGSDGGIPFDTSVSHDASDWERYDPDWAPPTDPPPAPGEYDVEVLAEHLAIPWDLSFAPTGELFLTERTGRITAFDAGELRTVAEPGAVVDAEAIDPGSDEGSWLVEGGEGGLLGVAVHPTYPEPPLLYAYFTTETDAGKENRVVAFDASADDPGERSWPVVEGIPAHNYHNGGRLAFGPANYLWVTAGDGDPELEQPDRARDPGSPGGSILRLEPDGSAPADSPDWDDADADPRVYTVGHRNPQGISWLPDATPVITEHGPGQGDELNVLAPGEDYGWPDVRNSNRFEGYGEYEGDVRPPVADAGAWAPAGGVFYTGDALPRLRNRLLFGGLISQQLTVATLVGPDGSVPTADHVTLHEDDWYDDAYRVGTSPLLPDELGRVRHVEQGPDGALYAITSNRDGRAQGEFPTDRDDLLVRITRE